MIFIVFVIFSVLVLYCDFFFHFVEIFIVWVFLFYILFLKEDLQIYKHQIPQGLSLSLKKYIRGLKTSSSRGDETFVAKEIYISVLFLDSGKKALSGSGRWHWHSLTICFLRWSQTIRRECFGKLLSTGLHFSGVDTLERLGEVPRGKLQGVIKKNCWTKISEALLGKSVVTEGPRSILSELLIHKMLRAVEELMHRAAILSESHVIYRGCFGNS